MPFEVILSEVPMGVAAKASRKGETASVRITGFVSSEDGHDLITHLEKFPSTLLAKAVGDRISPSQVDNLLAIIRRDKTATVYVNELDPELTTKVGRTKEKGDPVFKDDIVDITRADLGVDVPADAAVVFVFSWGWRKGVFYDFGPVGPDARPRAFDLPGVLGELYARLIFQERFRISDDEWTRLFKAGWFPFVGLGNETINLMLTHLRAGWDLDELTPRVVEEVRGKVPAFLEAWKLHPALATHAPLLEKAVTDFLSENYVSCSGLLFPRIEGILRSTPAFSGADRTGSLLMPHRFEDYLREVYLSSFNPDAPRAGEAVGRAGAAGFDGKSSSVALLVVHQLFHSFEPAAREHEVATSAREGNANPRVTTIEPVEAANRWHQWSAKGPDSVLAQLIERLDENLPGGWKRLHGEELGPYRSLVRPGAAWYSLATTPQYIGVTLSVERTSAGGMRGGRVWFARLPFPPTATIPAAWDQVMQFLDAGIVVAARSAGAPISAPSPDALFLAELPPEIAESLCTFSRSARKSLPLAPDDSQRWSSFVIGAFRARAVVDDRRLVEWFVHEGWEREAARELSRRFFDQCRLLNRYVEEVASA
jgi:hypothetical protein